MEEKSRQSEQQEEKRIQKNKDRVRSFWYNFKCTNIQIIGMLEGEEEKQEIENLLKKMKGNFHNLVKEIRHTSPRNTETPRQVERKETHDN